LGVPYSEAAEFGDLLDRFDAFGYHVQPQGVCHAENEFDDGCPVRAAPKFFDKGTVDFQRPG
jgi:hypothetical protein